MRAPLITVAIPYLHDRATIGRAIQSVFAQSFTDWELLLVNDGARDGTDAMVAQISDARVRFAGDSSNRGLSARLNEIAQLATAPYVARMDADDIMHPLRLERQLARLERAAGSAIVAGAVFTIDEHEAVRGVRGVQPLDPRPASVLRRGLLIHPTVMARKSWLLANPYDATHRRLEDLELWLRTCSHTQFEHIAEPLLYYREPRTIRLSQALRSHSEWRQLIRREGPSVLGWPGTLRALGEVYARDAAYRAAHALRRSDLVIDRRNMPLTQSSRDIAESGLAQVRASIVSGLTN